MELKKRTKQELENKIQELENFIAKKGVGSGYLAKAERTQRNLNIALFLGITTTLIGITAWMLSDNKED